MAERAPVKRLVGSSNLLPGARRRAGERNFRMNRLVRPLAISLCLTLLGGAACDGNDKSGDAAKGTEVTKAEIAIGAIFDLSGPTADPGTPYSQGVRDYVEYRNAEGGVEGHRINLLWQDFGSGGEIRTPDQALNRRPLCH